MRRIGPALMVALLLAACATAPSAESPGVGAGETAAPASPAESLSAAATFPGGPAPEGCVRPPPDVTSVMDQTDPLACYGGAEFTIEALVGSPGTFSCPGELRPSWFDCFHLVALNPVPGTSLQPEFLLVARSAGEPLYAVLHPEIETLRPRVMDTLVRLSGHYDDPAAMDCVYASYPDPGPPPATEVVDMCRATFVITAMEPLVES